MSNLKKKIKEMQPTIGSWITIGDPIVVEIMAKSGFDWLTIDMEHSAITLDIAQNLIRIIEQNNCVPLVRVPENNSIIIKMVMDAGAHGVIVPMVNSKNDAIAAVQAVRYPPEGCRGVGLARAQGYGFTFDKYKQWLETESVIIAQIEHIDAVRNIESIISVPGIDGCIVGPYDLSGSMGIPGEFNDQKVLNALHKVEQCCKTQGVSLGMHVIPPDYTIMVDHLSRGYTFLAFSLDTLFLGTSCKNQLENLKKKMK